MSRGLLGLAGAFLAFLEQMLLSTKNRIFHLRARANPGAPSFTGPFEAFWLLVFFVGGPCGVNGGAPKTIDF